MCLTHVPLSVMSCSAYQISRVGARGRYTTPCHHPEKRDRRPILISRLFARRDDMQTGLSDEPLVGRALVMAPVHRRAQPIRLVAILRFTHAKCRDKQPTGTQPARDRAKQRRMLFARQMDDGIEGDLRIEAGGWEVQAAHIRLNKRGAWDG